jgi:hypothetical protein
MQVETEKEFETSPAIHRPGEGPSLAAAVEEAGYTAPLIANPIAAVDTGAAAQPGPWDDESPLDAAILRGLVHP